MLRNESKGEQAAPGGAPGREEEEGGHLPVQLRLSQPKAGQERMVDVGGALEASDLTPETFARLYEEDFDKERAEQWALALEDRHAEVEEFFENRRLIAEAHRDSSWGTWYAGVDRGEALAFATRHHGLPAVASAVLQEAGITHEVTFVICDESEPIGTERRFEVRAEVAPLPGDRLSSAEDFLSALRQAFKSAILSGASEEALDRIWENSGSTLNLGDVVSGGAFPPESVLRDFGIESVRVGRVTPRRRLPSDIPPDIWNCHTPLVAPISERELREHGRF